MASKPDSTVRLSAKDLTFLLLLALPAVSLAGTRALFSALTSLGRKAVYYNREQQGGGGHGSELAGA